MEIRGSGQQSGGGSSGVDRARNRSPRRGWLWLVGSALVLVALGVGFAVWASSARTARPPEGYRPGSCVVVETHERSGELRGVAASCDVDLSFTVAKIADQSDNCVPLNYTRIRPPFSDVATGRLCLVPNLVVGHCYRFGVPKGVWDLSACANAGPGALRITNRIDSDDPHACPIPREPSGFGIPALPFPNELRYPARVYCYDDLAGR